jgi:hypothetical protein
MDWLKKNFDRALLAVLGLLVLAFAGLLISKTLSFNDEFDSRNSTRRPDNNVPQPGTAEVKERIAALQKPAEWGAHTGSLFVSEPYVVKDGGTPVNPLKGGEPLFPPISNDWIVKYNLDFSNANLPNDDPDGDKFTNLEEFLGKTDPTSANARPPYFTKLRLAKFIQIPFRLKFSGSPDDGQTFSINTLDLRQPTQFLKIGDMVPKTPYKIVGYQKKSQDKNGIEVDVSELTVENQETGQKIVLVYDRPVNDPTVYALFKYLWDGSEIKVKKLESFSVQPESNVKYKLIDISDSEALIETPQGEKIHVPKADSQ